jgi:hypothetical protein
VVPDIPRGGHEVASRILGIDASFKRVTPARNVGLIENGELFSGGNTELPFD